MRCEKGQALVEFALVLPLLLAIMAMTTDAGLWFYTATRLHSGANAAAQAGAAMLPDTVAARDRAQLYAEANGHVENVTIDVTAEEITVVIQREPTLLFAQLFISEAPMLTGRAVYGRINYHE